MTDAIVALIVQYGLLLVFLNVLLEQAGLPLPAVPTLVVAGALAGAGRLSLGGVLLAALLACLLSDLAWYWAGRRYGGAVMRLLCRISLSRDSCVKQSELRFQRWRGRVLLVAKFVPGLSTVAPPLVGAMGLRLRSFVLLDALGSLLWIGVMLGLGHLFAGSIDRLLALLANAGMLAFELVLVLLLAYLLVRWWRRRRLLRSLRMERIDVAELHQAIATREPPLVLDVRSATARQLDARIIPGAMEADIRDLARVVRGIPHERELVTYCSCPNEVSAALAAKTLRQYGYRRVRPLRGGLEAWAAAGHALEALTIQSDLVEPAVSRRTG